MKIIGVFISLCLLMSVLNARAAATVVNHFYGTVKYSSPDGKISFGESVSLLKRSVIPEKKIITEQVLQPTGKNTKPNEFFTTLTRVLNTNTFEAKDEGKTFSGTVFFFGSEWSWANWRYSILLSSGGKLIGDGALSAQKGIITDKLIMNKEGRYTLRIHEELAPISEEKYEEIKKTMYLSK